MNISDLRREYELGGLDDGDLDDDPFAQFGLWLDQAMAADPLDPTSVVLATADRRGRPSARVVLLKGFDEQGFVFFTNYDSRKGRELAENPWAALAFFWAALDRQVRVEGEVEKVSAAESDAYYASRPLGSRLGAWASPQSRPLASRDDLEQALVRLAEEAEARQVRGEILPRPEFWGGYRLRPESIEFWQGRPSRLHDRFLYERQPDGLWRRTRLAP
jgi:pyridoxamine 5'-phosphate oxidase